MYTRNTSYFNIEGIEREITEGRMTGVSISYEEELSILNHGRAFSSRLNHLLAVVDSVHDKGIQDLVLPHINVEDMKEAIALLNSLLPENSVDKETEEQ